jgi:hypothetical protein
LPVANFDCARVLGRDILDERSSQGDIDDLDTATDAEDGDAARERRREEIELELVSDGIDAIGRGVERCVAVSLGVDVGTTAQEQTIDARNECVNSIALWWQDDGNSTGRRDGAHVVRGETMAEKRAMDQGVRL